MAKNHRQQRAQAKQNRLEAVLKKSAAGLMLRVPKLCREEPLFALCRDFYCRTGVDLLIGIPTNVKYGPQAEEIAVPVGLEVQILSTQLMQLYAVCFNAALKNVCSEKAYTQSSLELLLEASTEEERASWTDFLELINLARQFFCHYPYLWPNAVAEQGLNKLKHYLDISSREGSHCAQALQPLIEQEENGWLQLQQYIARMADELYAWLENVSLTRGGEPAAPGTWKSKIGVLYQPTQMTVMHKQNWTAPIDWWWRKYQLRQHSGIRSYNKPLLMNILEKYIEKREAGRPVAVEDFVLLQDQIYLWARNELERQYRKPDHTSYTSAIWRRK